MAYDQTGSVLNLIELSEVKLQMYNSLRSTQSSEASSMSSETRSTMSELEEELAKLHEQLSSFDASTLRTIIAEEQDEKFATGVPRDTKEFETLLRQHMTSVNMTLERVDTVMTQIATIGPNPAATPYRRLRRSDSIDKTLTNMEVLYTADLLEKKTSSDMSSTLKDLRLKMEKIAIPEAPRTNDDDDDDDFDYTVQAHPVKKDDTGDDTDYMVQAPPSSDQDDYLLQRLSDSEEGAPKNTPAETKDIVSGPAKTTTNTPTKSPSGLSAGKKGAAAKPKATKKPNVPTRTSAEKKKK